MDTGKQSPGPTSAISDWTRDSLGFTCSAVPLGTKILNTFKLWQLYEKEKLSSGKSWMKMKYGLVTKMLFWKRFKETLMSVFAKLLHYLGGFPFQIMNG